MNTWPCYLIHSGDESWISLSSEIYSCSWNLRLWFISREYQAPKKKNSPLRFSDPTVRWLSPELGKLMLPSATAGFPQVPLYLLLTRGIASPKPWWFHKTACYLALFQLADISIEDFPIWQLPRQPCPGLLDGVLTQGSGHWERDTCLWATWEIARQSERSQGMAAEE